MTKDFYLIHRGEKRTTIIEAKEQPMRLISQGWEIVEAEAFYAFDAIWQYEALQRKAEAFVSRYGKEYHTPCDYQTSDEENAFSYRHYIDAVADDIAKEIAILHEAIEEMRDVIDSLEEQLDEACDLVRYADDYLEAIEASQTTTLED